MRINRTTDMISDEIVFTVTVSKVEAQTMMLPRNTGNNIEDLIDLLIAIKLNQKREAEDVPKT